MSAGYLTTLIDRAPTVETLGGVLQHQHRLLERLLFRMHEVALLLAAGEHRFIVRAIDEVTEIEQQLGEADMVRALVVNGLAERWGIPKEDLSLAAIVEQVSEESGRRLAELREGMMELVEEVALIRRHGHHLAVHRSEHAVRFLSRSLEAQSS